MKVTFPHMGDLWIIIKTLFETLDVEVVVPPPNSKKTLNLGTKLAPESACLPLKLNIGNFIEAKETGADTIVMTGGIGPCRFGLYGELEREILKEAGYDFDAIILEPPDGSIPGLLRRIRYLVGDKHSWVRILGAIRFAYTKSVTMDRIEDIIHGARPRLGVEAEVLYRSAKDKLVQATSYAGLEQVVRGLRTEVKGRQLARIEQQSGLEVGEPLKVGIVGEIYTILDPYSSVDVEEQLGQLGAHVDRSIYLSAWVAKHVFLGVADGYKSLKPYHKLAKPYLNHFVGGHGQETVGAVVKYARSGFDGIIHLFPLTCMPEIVASSILPRVQQDYKIPVMTLIVDEHTGHAGVQTRLEAFVDLLERSRHQRSILSDGERDTSMAAR